MMAFQNFRQHVRNLTFGNAKDARNVQRIPAGAPQSQYLSFEMARRKIHSPGYESWAVEASHLPLPLVFPLPRFEKQKCGDDAGGMDYFSTILRPAFSSELNKI